MQLTGKEIIEKQIIKNYCNDGIQQQGVDVRLKSIRKMSTLGGGYVPAQGKTRLPEGYSFKEEEKFELQPGYYEIVFEEGVMIPNNCTLHFKTRSSLVRCGAEVLSGQFDAGFHTENAGAFLHVILPITIEKGARVAQAIVFVSNPVGNLYEGQWQGDKQRM